MGEREGEGEGERERTQQSVYLAFTKLNPNLTYRSSFSNDNYKINTASGKKDDSTNTAIDNKTAVLILLACTSPVHSLTQPTTETMLLLIAVGKNDNDRTAKTY